MTWFRDTALDPDVANPALVELDSSTVQEPTRAVDLVRRPEVPAETLARVGGAPFLERDVGDAMAAVEVELKYEGYVRKEAERAQRLRSQESFRIPEEIGFAELHTLSSEAREKLGRVRPATLGQAGRVPGVSPADLQNLMLEVRRWRRARTEAIEGS